MNAADSAMAQYCNGDAFFYAQTPCIIPSKEIKPRLVMGLIISCISLMVVLFCISYVQYAQGVQAYRYVDYDYNTLLASDYTVEFDINRKMWDNFL